MKPKPPAAHQRDAFDELLAPATLMCDAQASVLDLLPQPGAPEGLIAAWGIARADARAVVEWMHVILDGQERGGITAISVPAERWPASVARLGGQNDGEAVTLPLVDDTGSLGRLVVLSQAGGLGRPPLNLPRTRAALVSQLTAQARTILDARTLREQRDQLESIFTYSGDGLLTVDTSLRITGCNPALEHLIAWPTRAMLGRFYYDVLRPEDPQGIPLGLARCPLLEAFATRAPVVARDLIIRARDGQRIDVAVTAAAIRSPEGVPISGVLNVRDVSRKNQQEVLSSTIVSVISHELQTPIAIIKGYAATLSRPDANWQGEALHSRLHAIEEEADRLSHMVNNLLYASRIQAGGLTMEPGPVDVAEVLQSTVRRFRARVERHQLRLHMPQDLPLVLADRARIEEVVANLLENAVKYSPQASSITVEGSFTSDQVIVSVSDQGPGIPLREQERIFDRFQRVEGDLTRNTAGAGLGLFICRAIVRAHGGQIWVASELGHGATFAFSLPRLEPAAVLMVVTLG